MDQNNLIQVERHTKRHDFNGDIIFTVIKRIEKHVNIK